MKSAVVLFPGSNRERDAARALRWSARHAPMMVWHADHNLPQGTDLVVLPGGFSYGDYLRCGAIAARSPVMGAVRRHAARGGLVLGICNGFQILCEAGLLPGVLMRNADRRFICKMQHLRVENANTSFTRRYAPGQIVKFAIAHGEGNFEADDETLSAIEGAGQVAFRYCSAAGDVDEASNPNGSERSIAGVFNDRFNVLGLMPHPENLIDPLTGGVDGAPLFQALAACAASLSTASA
jgi:phosphoribosylformylglycinamidine synthase subunit PurQ / glutaminase